MKQIVKRQRRLERKKLDQFLNDHCWGWRPPFHLRKIKYTDKEAEAMFHLRAIYIEAGRKRMVARGLLQYSTPEEAVKLIPVPSDKEIDKIYDEVYRLIVADDMISLNNLFPHKVRVLHADILVSWLTTTLPVKSKLQYREYFYKEVEKELKARMIWEDGLLSGLE